MSGLVCVASAPTSRFHHMMTSLTLLLPSLQDRLTELIPKHPILTLIYENAETIRLCVGMSMGAVMLFRAVKFVASMALLPSQAVGMNVTRLNQMREAFKNTLDERDPGAVLEELAVPIVSTRRLPAVRDGGDGRKQTRAPTLDAIFVRHSASPSPSAPLMLYLSANGMCYEDVLPDAYTLSRELGRNLVMMNYRGVGRSEARTVCGDDLIEDVVSTLKYLESEFSVPGRDVLIWGHSIGGAAGVAAAVKTKHVGALMSDRSFYKLSLVIAEKIKEGPLAPGICGMVAALITVEVATVHLFAYGRMGEWWCGGKEGKKENTTHSPHPFLRLSGPWPSLEAANDVVTNAWLGRVLIAGISLAWVASIRLPMMSFARSFVLGSTACVVIGDVLDRFGLIYASSLPPAVLASFALFFEIGARGWLDRFLLRVVDAIGWEMEARWGEVAKGVVKMASYHPHDEMIPVSASMARVEPNAVQMAGKYATPALLMEGRRVAGPVCHMYFPDVEEWRGYGVVDAFKRRRPTSSSR